MQIGGLTVDLLSSWLSARNAQSAFTSARAAGLNTNASVQAANKPKVLPPWDIRAGITGLDELSREALGGRGFFRSREFSDLEAPQDHRDLFTLHQGLRRLFAVASEAAEASTLDSRRSFLDGAFSDGLAELTRFLEDLDLEALSVVGRSKLDEAESAVAVSRGVSEYVTGVIHEGDFDAAVDAFQGNVQFQIAVTKNGIETPVDIDLNDMGATVRSLDNVAEHINSRLESAGVLTRFDRVKIGEPDEFGIVSGNQFGFKITGIESEKVRFNAVGTASAYVLGQSGGSAGQLSKLDGLSGTPEFDFINRIELDGAAEAETEAALDEESEQPVLTPVSVAAGPNGEIFALAEIEAGLDGMAPRGEKDLALIKYDSTGKRLWTRVLGATNEISGADMTVTAAGDVVIAGALSGAFGDTSDGGGSDGFVTRYSATGSETFFERFGATGNESVADVAIADDGTIYLAGTTSGRLDGETSGGGGDAFIRAMTAEGELIYTRQFGGAGDQTASALTLDGSGGLYVATQTNGEASLTRYDAADGDSAATWTHDIGALNGGSVAALRFDGGALYAAGSAGALSDLASSYAGHSGSRDGFLMKIGEGASSPDYVSFVGGVSYDDVKDFQINDGAAYLTGSTRNDLSGGGLNGDINTYVAKLDLADGSSEFINQISGRGGQSAGAAIAIDPAGDSILDQIGLPRGTLDYGGSTRLIDASSVRAGDKFSISVDGGRSKDIVIDEDETFLSLTFKINAALILDGKASVKRSSEGDRLLVEAREGSKIELIAGPSGQDALSALGLSEGVVVKEPVSDEDSASSAPPLYGLGVDFASSLATKEGAIATKTMLLGAMSAVQDAFRDITRPDPSSLPKANGPPPAYLQAQLANFQAGLDRLNAGAPQAGLLI